MEEVFGEGVIGHVLGNEKPLIAVAAVTDQIGKPGVAQLANARSLFDELLGIGPRGLAELLDGNPALLLLKATLVDDVGRLLPALRHDVLRAEIVGRRFQV